VRASSEDHLSAALHSAPSATTSVGRSVRPAREDDLERLIEIARRSWLSAFAQTAPFALIEWWVRTDRTTALYREHWPEMLVLEDSGLIIGLVQPIDAEINGLWVHPDWQGRGAGTALLRTGEEIVRRAGHSAAWLTCSAFNGKALEFYRRRGYLETARERERHACGIEIENVRLERRIA
jgi:[ribosomal protein S18]-alanine N-acetyltransferase